MKFAICITKLQWQICTYQQNWSSFI